MIYDKCVKYLIYLDILGFDELAKEIEKNENIKSDVVRDKIFKNPINEEIKQLKEGGKIFGVSEGRDDWILVIDNFNNIFESISRILRIMMPVGKYAYNVSRDYGNISFEVAVGVYEFDEWATLDGKKVICNDRVIEFLKTYIIPIYSNTYKKENSFEIGGGDLSEEHLKREFLKKRISLTKYLIEEEIKDERWKVIDKLNKYIIEKDRSSFKVSKILTESFVICTNHFFEELKNNSDEKYFVENEFAYTDKKTKKDKKYYLLKKENVIKEGKIPDFLNKIGQQSKSDFSGALIDRIFVPPEEYDEIKKSLKNNRIVFITGTAGYGKTYLAIRLLWEKYDDEGYIPGWISGKEKDERKDVRKRLTDIEAELKPKHIIYFEDPFGKVEYEKRDDLEENIRGIIDSVKNKRDCFAIITSRKDVFEKFKKESFSAAKEIEAIEKELNIIKPSYSDEKRKKILEKWAEEKGCKWLLNDNIKNIVFDSIKDKSRLPTPLAIYNFVVATKNETNENTIRQKIDEYSKELTEVFAKEIIKLPKDRMLFLSFILVSENFEKEFIKQEYEKLKEENFEDFEKILKEEYRVIPTIWGVGEKEILKFSHPSYSQAIPYVLEDVGCRKIFCNVLKELAEKDSAVRDVARAVAKNFDKLPEDVRNLLFKLAEKDSVAGDVAQVIAYNFDKLPEDVRNLLFKLAEKDSAVRGVAWAIIDNFDKLPEDVRNLLFELAKKDSAAGDVAWAIVYNFDKLPEDVRNLLFELAKKDSAVRGVAWAIAYNFDKLPEDVRNLLFELAEKDSAAGDVAQAIAYNFDKLPEDVRNLLFELAEKDSAAGGVAQAIVNNFDKLPEDVRNKLLFKLAEKDSAAGGVAWAIAYNFDKLPEDVRNLLFKLAEKDSAAGGVAWAIAYNFDKLSEDVRNLLFELAEKDSAAGGVAWAIAYNFDKLSEDVRNLLFELAEKDSAAGGVAWAVAKNFEKLPDDVRNLLFTDKVQKGLIKVIEKLSNSKFEWERQKTEKFKKFLKK